MKQLEHDPLQSSRVLLDLFYPGSFPDPMHLPIEPKKIARDPEPLPASQDLAAMEKRIIAALTGRKPEAQSPFLKRKEAIQLLKTRSTLERCEKAGWLKATIRRPRLVLYRRTDVMACVYRISQGEYP